MKLKRTGEEKGGWCDASRCGRKRCGKKNRDFEGPKHKGQNHSAGTVLSYDFFLHCFRNQIVSWGVNYWRRNSSHTHTNWHTIHCLLILTPTPTHTHPHTHTHRHTQTHTQTRYSFYKYHFIGCGDDVVYCGSLFVSLYSISTVLILIIS